MIGKKKLVSQVFKRWGIREVTGGGEVEREEKGRNRMIREGYKEGRERREEEE